MIIYALVSSLFQKKSQEIFEKVFLLLLKLQKLYHLYVILSM